VLGIDVSKAFFDVALYRVCASRSAPAAQTHQFENALTGFQALARWLKDCRVKHVHACLEATGRYGDELALWLHTHGHDVSVVNPAVIHSFAQMQMQRNKTDGLDAKLIGAYCLSHRPDLWTPPAQETLDLQAFLKHLANLQDMRQQERNRLESIIPSERVVAAVQAHIDFLEAQIAHLKRLIRDHINAAPRLLAHFTLLRSIPAIGDLTAWRLLALDLLRFDDADALVAFAGLNPAIRRSGTSVRGRTQLSKRGHAAIRRDLYMPAVVALKHNPVIRAFAATLTAKGKHIMVVIGAVMRKLLRLAYGVLKSGRPFDPAWHTS
jgi:transposase